MENGSVFILSAGKAGRRWCGVYDRRNSTGTGRWIQEQTEAGVECQGGREGCKQKELGLELSGTRLQAGFKQGSVFSDGLLRSVSQSVTQACSPCGNVCTLMLRALFCPHLIP